MGKMDKIDYKAARQNDRRAGGRFAFGASRQTGKKRGRPALCLALVAILIAAALTACGTPAGGTVTQAAETTAAATTTATTTAATTAATTTTAAATTAAAATTTAAPATTTAAPTTTTAATTAAATTTAAPVATTSEITTAAASPADGSWDKIQSNGKFILGLDDSFPPMGYRDENNEIVGFDIDMAKAAAEYLGVEVELKPVIWDTVLLSLNSGEIDCVWNGMSVTEERKKEITFSKSYVNSDQIVVTLKDSDIKAKADLAGMVVGTQMGSSTIDALDAEPQVRDSFGELREYATFTEAMMDLDNRRLDAVVIDGIAFYGDFNVKSPDSYSVLGENFGREEMAIGLRQTDGAWIAKINEALDYLRSSGKAAEISVKWFGEDILII